jgi:hypothetical protein
MSHFKNLLLFIVKLRFYDFGRFRVFGKNVSMIFKTCWDLQKSNNFTVLDLQVQQNRSCICITNDLIFLNSFKILNSRTLFISIMIFSNYLIIYLSVKDNSIFICKIFLNVCPTFENKLCRKNCFQLIKM